MMIVAGAVERPKLLLNNWGGNRARISVQTLRCFRLGDELWTPTKVTKERLMAEGNFGKKEMQILANMQKPANDLLVEFTEDGAKAVNVAGTVQPLSEAFFAIQRWAVDRSLIDEHYAFLIEREKEVAKMISWGKLVDISYKTMIFSALTAFSIRLIDLTAQSDYFYLFSAGMALTTLVLRHFYKSSVRENLESAAAFNLILALNNRDNVCTKKKTEAPKESEAPNA